MLSVLVGWMDGWLLASRGPADKGLILNFVSKSLFVEGFVVAPLLCSIFFFTLSGTAIIVSEGSVGCAPI